MGNDNNDNGQRPQQQDNNNDPPVDKTPAASNTKHKRGVSWDALVMHAANHNHNGNHDDDKNHKGAGSGNTDKNNSNSNNGTDLHAEAVHDDNISAVTQPNESSGPGGASSPPLRNVSLKDIAGVAPIESEAESLLISALEESQPPTEKVEGTALNDLTAEEESLFAPPSTQASSRPLPPTSKRSIFSRSAAKDTTKNLWELAAQLQLTQQQHKLHANQTDPGGSSDQHQLHSPLLSSSSSSSHGGEAGHGGLAVGGQSDLLALHAARLLARRKQGGDGTPTTEAPEAPANKWGKLRAAVKANTAVSSADPKKTDGDGNQGLAAPSIPEEVTAGHSDGHDGDIEQGSHGGGSKQNNVGTAGGARRKTKEHHGLMGEFEEFRQWVSFKKTTLFGYIRKLLLFAILPSTGIAAALFYLGSNPPCGTQQECLDQSIQSEATGRNETRDDGVLDNLLGSRERRYDSASVAWWILFIGCRQVITLSLAMMMEAIVIDFWVLRAKLASKLLGPYLSLFIVQAKGWPIRLIFWSLLDIGMLYGDRPFSRHWLFWQDEIELFNKTNPGGNVTESSQYKALLAISCAIGGLVAIKRFYIGLRLGQKTYTRYSADLAKLLKKTILVSEVANLASEIVKYDLKTADFGLHTEIYKDGEDDGSTVKPSSSGNMMRGKSLATMTDIAAFTSEHKIRIAELLGEWEEPELNQAEEEHVDIGSIIQFRKSLQYLNTQFPFGVLFGPADSRESCVRSAEGVYRELKSATPDSDHVVFDTLALTGVQRDGTLDDHKLRELIKVFRPDRDGRMTVLDFCKSIDAVYKELRLFRASVANAGRMDRSFERIINIIFYFIVGSISLAILGIDPFALFAAISGFILGFAFMIGAACSKYFEGLLMVLISRPYDIGDKIQVAPVTSDSSGTGSAYWLVKDVGLYNTTYMFWTQETAICSNGALAGTRIINASRSPQALLITMFKFPIDTPYRKIEIFQATIEKFVKARPREWLSFLAFRPTRVEADGGFVEYVFIAQHRENWANIGALKNSLADVSYFALELTKRMEMRYTAPPMPINLNMGGGDSSWNNIQKQMAAQIASQSERLGGDQNASMLGAPASAPRAQTAAPQEEYDFADIEAMFDKNK